MGSSPIGPTRGIKTDGGDLLLNLKNKVAWISGGARMGLAVAQKLIDAGCFVALTWRRSRTAADATVRQLRNAEQRAMSVQCDLARPGSIRLALVTIHRRFKRLDVVVNLASIYETTPPGLASGLVSWQAHMEANARSAYALTLAAAPQLAASGQGRVILVSDWTSASGRPRYKDYSAYYVSKAAVKAVVEGLALQLAPRILVNGIAPGPMLAPPAMALREQRAVAKATPLARWGGAEAMAHTVRFLAETDFITGETLRLDGGRHLI